MDLTAYTNHLVENTFLEIVIILGISLLVAGSLFLILRFLSTRRKLPISLRALGSSWMVPAPIVLLLLGGLLSFETFLLDEGFETPAEMVNRLRSVFVVIALVALTLRWKTAVEKSYVADAAQKGMILAIGRLSSIVIFIIAGLMILRIFEIPIEALLALGGIGTLTVGWAGKDVVANLFGGLMLTITRPFAIGDYIKSPNKNFVGVVEEMGWYMTLLRDPDRLPTYIPNALMTDAVVHNYTRMPNRRIKRTIGLRYSDFSKIEVIIEGIRQMLLNHPEIETSAPLMVHFLDYGDSTLDIELIACTKTNTLQGSRDVQQDVLLKAGQIIAQHGAEMAFPTQTIYLEKD